MLYTSVDKVKQHLATTFPVSDGVHDQSLVLSGTDFVTFFGGAIDESSLAVKSHQSTGLTRQTPTLGNPMTSLPDALLIRGTVVVASDSSLGTVYTENVDYIIDYQAGKLTIKNGGALAPGRTVAIWYEYYNAYVNNSDYVLDATAGSIRRLASGDIASGETVFLDYSPIIPNYTEELLQSAVDEANALIEKSLDANQQFWVDPTLQAAATYRALEIISRASAARELSSQGGEDRVALAWLKLSGQFANRADELIKSFRPPFDSPSAPAQT